MEVHLLCGSIYYEVREQTKLISTDRSQMVIFQGVPLTGEWRKGAARMLELLSARGFMSTCNYVSNSTFKILPMRVLSTTKYLSGTSRSQPHLTPCKMNSF